MSEPTDFDKRREEFLTQFGKLREEFQCDFYSIPQYIPNEQGTWSLQIVPQVADLKQIAVKSPIIV